MGFDTLGISKGHWTGLSELVKPDGLVTSCTGHKKETN